MADEIGAPTLDHGAHAQWRADMAQTPPQQRPAVDELFPARKEDVDALFPAHVEQDHQRQVLRHGIQTGTISSRIQDMLFGEEGPVAHAGRIGKAMWEKGAEGAEAGWESLAPSKETEEFLTKHGILNDYKKNEFSAIKAINGSIIKTPAFVAAIANGFFAGGQAGVAQTGTEAGAPKFGREIAALPEGFMGSPHPTGTPKLTPGRLWALGEQQEKRAAEAAAASKPDPVTGEVAKPAVEINLPGHTEFDAAKAPGEAGVPAETAPTAPEGPPQPSPLEGEGVSRESPPRDVHQVAHDIDPPTIAADRDLAKRQDVMREWLADLRETRDREIEEGAPHAEEIARLQRKIDDEDTTPRLRKKYQARLAPLIEERDAHIEDARAGGDSPDMARIRKRLQEVDYARRDLAPAVTEAYRRAREIVPEEPEEAAAPAAPSGEDYVAQAMGNLKATSRTAQGVLDVSAGEGKAGKMVAGLTGEKAADTATRNFEAVIRDIYAGKDSPPKTGPEAVAFIDAVAARVNEGIVKPGELDRTHETTNQQTPVAELPEAKRRFGEELAARLADPSADPVETAAWIEWRANIVDHFWSDGVGKTSKALAAIPLMRANLPLPKYPAAKEFFSYTPKNGGTWERFNSFYHTLVYPKESVQPLLERGASLEELSAHPAVVYAVEENRQRVPTGRPEDFTDPAWRARRVYDFDGKEVHGTEAAVAELVDKAKSYSKDGPVEQGQHAIIVIGPPAAGKSTISNPIARRYRAAVVDADDAKLVIPEYQKGLGTNAVHEESSVMAKEVLASLLRDGSNIVLPKVGENIDSIRRTATALREKGYTVDLVHAAATPELSGRRNIARFVKTGRIVDPKYIAEVGDKPRANYHILKGEGFNETADFDTSSPPTRAIEGADSAVAGAVGSGDGRNLGRPPAGGDQAGAQAPGEAPLQAQVTPPEPLSKGAPPIHIATDVFDKLIAAGRPREEAEALAAIHAAYWETRAARFGGRKGTAAEMYAREAADIKAGPGVKPAAELPPGAAEPIPPRAVKGAGGEKTAVNGVVDFAPGDLIVDAKRFQFKAGGDESGMTDRLKGVTRWDPVKAGMVLVWQDREGRHYITDGHQRWNLARRIAAEDPSQNPRLNGWVVRESDGVTDTEARAMAASKNIAEGTGTAVDAAKVLRDYPELLKDLPPRSELVRQARALVNLNPNAFGMVVNEVVPPNYAAIVGDLVPRDFPMQDAILKLLAQIEPSNVTEAEAITRQAIDVGNANVAKRAQGDLFGDAQAVNLYGVRAKVFARTMALLRRDKKVFAVLTKEQSLIESGGNRLAADVNERRAIADAQALQVLQTLANRTGPISDALNAAAKRAHGDGKYADAAGDFAAAVRREAESGDLARLADGERRSGEHAGAEGEAGDRVAPAKEDIPLFVDEDRADKANEQVLELLEGERTLFQSARHQIPGQLDIFGAANGSGSQPVRGTAPQVSGGKPAGRPQRADPVRRPAQVSLFDWGAGERPAGAGDGGSQQGNQKPPVSGEGSGVTKPPAGGGGADTARPDQPAGAGGRGGRGAGGGRGGVSQSGLSQADASTSAQQAIAKRSRSNYRITETDKVGEGGPKDKVRANIDAIRILKRIEDEGREATPEEKAQLVRYSGWGAFAQDMFTSRKAEWKNERDAYRALVTDEEYEAAKGSTLNAHFTSPDVVRGMWDALDHLGFKGGMALEPSAGIGHFIGLIPDKMAPKTAWTAVELDPITGRIAKALYGGAEVNVHGFEDLKRPSNYYDLAISNVPFGDYNIKEKPYGSFPIHDFFFVKSLDKVRPGGVVAFITSRYTMDRVNPATRRLLSQSADLVGAIRLPGGKAGAFAGNAGTQVTTDIIFLRKKIPGEAPFPGADWQGLKEIQTPEGPTKVNEFFADRPHMMLGEMRLQGTMYRDNEPVLIGEAAGLQGKIAAAARSMPEGSFVDRAPPPPTIHSTEIASGVKDGAFFLKDGALYRRENGQGVAHALSPPDHARVTKLIGMRDVINDLLPAQLAGDEALADIKRGDLRRAYDAFVAEHGPINKEERTVTSRLNKDGEPVVIVRYPNLKAFDGDPDFYKVAAIEDYDADTDAAKPAAIQLRNVINPPLERQINGPSDALAAALDTKGEVDLDHIGQSLNLATHDDVVAALGDLIYHNPDGRKWQAADHYLSGNVVKKLEEARAIAKQDSGYLRNVAALEKVQPTPLKGSDITAQFGAPWVPAEVYKGFLEEIGGDKVRLSQVPITGEWKLGAGSWSRDARTKYGTDHIDVEEIAEAALNNRQVAVWDKNPDGSRSVNQEATTQARVKTDLLKEAFTGDRERGVDGWAFAEPERSKVLEDIYNRTFNNLVARQFDGSHQTLPGLNRDFAGRKHRLDAVWRIVQNGNTLLAHVVGSGKTATMIAAGMEQKRLGLINKPAYVIPNHMLEQFSREFLQAYPDAKILVAEKEEMSRDNRKALLAKVSANDWDGVIITHDAFGRINMAQDFRRQYIQEQLDEAERIRKAEAKESGDKSPTVKGIEKVKKKLQAKLDALLNEERKDEGTTFEESGIDHLFMDEAHKFKNLSFMTRMQQVKGLAQGNAQRAEDLFLKIRYLEQKRPGRSAVFATGTPVSNTMAELYTMQRYLQLDKLKEAGLDNFDAWASTFGKVVNNMELSADGRTFKEVSSFSRFVNIPELISLYSEVADTKTADMLNLARPEVKTRRGAPGIEIVEATPSAQEEAHINALVKLAESLKGKRPEKGQPNMLSVVTAGRKVATDGRLISGDFDFNPQGKIALGVDNIARIWREGKEPGTVQMVFLDMGVPQTRGKKGPTLAIRRTADGQYEVLSKSGEPVDVFASPKEAEDFANNQKSDRIDLYADIKQRLVEKGIPADQIAAIHDAADDVKKARLFARVRSGDVRVILGSSEKMGVGTNVQDRLIAMHHLDAPWKPAEVEQRDGRIVRQGNKNPEVQIYRYVTKRSFDAFMWQKLDTKSKFIGQVLSGAKGSRFAEDIDNPLPEAAEMKAAASGDPRIMEHAELDRQARALTAQRRVFESTRSRAEWESKAAKSRVEQYENALPTAKEDAAGVQDLAADKFAVDLGGQAVTDRAEAGKAILERLTGLDPRSFYSPKVINVGKMSGFDMSLEMRGLWSGDGAYLEATPILKGKSSYGNTSRQVINEHTDAGGLIRRFENILGQIKQNPERLTKELDTERTNVEKLESTIGAAWPKEAEYRDTLARLDKLSKDMKAPTHPDVAEAKAGGAEGETELFQNRQDTKRGKIRLKPGERNTITLLKDANASTFIHETGHDWLDRMMKDAEDGQAPDDLKADAKTVLKWLGVDKAGDIKTKHHERFARGFETYMMEGRAPTRALAGVFAKLKAWLFKIYESAASLKAPINDDIRGVFDRLLAIDPQPVTIVPEVEGIRDFADRHEAHLAKPAHVDDIKLADELDAERDRIAALHLRPELQDARFAGIESAAERRAAGGPELDRHGNETRPDQRGGGDDAQAGALGAGEHDTAGERFSAPSKPGPRVSTEPPAGPHQPFERDTGHVDKAGNIRLDTLNTEDDVANVIRETAAKNDNFQDVRGPIPDGMVIDLADAMGMDASYLDTRKLGEAWTAPQIVALRNLLVRSATAVKDAMVKASLGNEADVLAYAEAKARHRMIQERVSSVTAEAGRALRAFQRRFSAGMAEAQAVGDFLKDATGQTLFQLQQEAKYGAKLYTPQQVAKFVNDSTKKGFQEKIIFYYVNALISGPITHLRYSVGNAINAIEHPLIEIPAAAVVGKTRALLGLAPNGDRVYLGEAGAQLYAIGKGSRDGLSAAIEAFKSGVSPPLPGERLMHAMELRQPIPGPVGYAIGVPGRSVAGIHSFFKSIRYEQEKAGLAYRQAMKEGLTGDAFANRVAQLEKDPTAPIMDAATKAALRELYMSPTEYSGFMGNLTRAVNQNLVAKIMAPFIKIGTQITRNAFVERTPLGLFSKEVRENVMGRGGEEPELTGTAVGPGATQDVQVAKIAIGTALFGTAIGMAAEGLVTGDGPPDPDKRAVWLLNHRPNSMQVGGITIPYRGLGHLGMLMGFGANLYESAHAIDSDDEWHIIARSFFEGTTKSVLDENFMRGVKDALDALYHPKEYGDRYVRQFATNWIPFSVGLGQVAREPMLGGDPYQRETNTLLQTAQAKFPLLSEMLMPKRDMFGEPIENSGAQEKYKNDPVVKAMNDLHIGVGKLHRKIDGIELTDKQFDDYRRIAGRTTKLMLNQLVSLPGWESIPPGIRIDMIHKTISKQRENAAKLVKALNSQDIIIPAVGKKIERMDKVPVH